MSNIWKKSIPQGNCEEPLEDISVSMVAWGGRLLLSAVDKDPSIERVEQGQSDRRVNLGSVCELMHSFPLSWDISAACPHALNSEQDLCPLCPLLTLPQAFVQTELYDFPFLSFSFFFLSLQFAETRSWDFYAVSEPEQTTLHLLYYMIQLYPQSLVFQDMVSLWSCGF